MRFPRRSPPALLLGALLLPVFQARPAAAAICKNLVPLGTGNDESFAVAVQSDGKIVAAGFSRVGTTDDFALVRYNPDCTLDTSFDGDGIVVTPIGAGDEQAQSVAIQTDGKIVAAGFSHNGTNLDFAVVRYNSNGSLDTGFNGTGKVVTPIGTGDDQGRAVAIQTDGKIVVAGYALIGGNDDFAVVRYNTNGTLDTTFNATGKVTTPIGAGIDRGEAVRIESGGKIVVAGDSYGANSDIAVVRYNSNGTLDASFDGDGKLTTPIGSGDDHARGLEIQTDGKIVVAGSSHNGTNLDFAIVRYLGTNGALDTSFDGDGKATTPIGGGHDLAYEIGIQSDGKLVAAGFSHNGTNFDFAVVRYLSSGALDTTFDADGIVTVPVGPGDDYGYGVALQGDGKIAVAGSGHNGTNFDVAFVRLNGDGSIDGTSRWYPKMTKRAGRGVFDAAPIVQGHWNAGSPGDLLSISTATPISSSFRDTLDYNQGSIVLWWTPENIPYSGPGGGQQNQVLFDSRFGDLRAHYDPLLLQFVFTVGGATVSAPLVVTAGTTYSLVFRWDLDNTLNGASYASISINDSHTFGIAAPPSPTARNTLGIGMDYSGFFHTEGIIEGFTIYRRPLYDGLNGIDAGNGDEINLTYNAGAALDPTLLTGSWDVVFALPTNAQTGPLTSGTGNAWTHPHAGNLVPGNSNRGGFMTAGSAAADGWNLEGAPTSVLPLAAAQKIYPGGFEVISNAANQGIRQDITVAPGDDWVVRAVVHSDGVCLPQVLLVNQNVPATIGSLTGTTSSTRTRPDVLILTGEAPAGNTTLRLKLVNAAASGACRWHQVEVLPNRLTNPSLETGAGNPWIPTGWLNQDLLAGEGSQELVTVHSGSSALRIVAPSAAKFNAIRQAHSDVVEDDFYSVGAFFYWNGGAAPLFYVTNGRLQFQSELDVDLYRRVSTAGSWQHVAAVGRRDDDSTNSNFDNILFGTSWMEASNLYFDDAYVVHLTNVPLNVVPASLTNSTEPGGEIRVDGLDTLFATKVNGLGTTSGLLTFSWRPRHDAANASKFAETTTGDAYILSLSGDSDDYVNVFWDANNIIKMEYSMAGATASGTWNAAGVISSGNLYAIEVAYTGGGAMTFKVNGTTRITLAGIPAAFGTAPDDVYYGSDRFGRNQGDATFVSIATAVKLASFSAEGSEGRITLLWETASELDNLGFHLHRSLAEDGPYERINSAIVPGLGSSPAGARYRYRDTPVAPGILYYYRLEDVDTDGTRTFHGPVSATAGGAGAPGAAAEETASITYGDPDTSGLTVSKRGHRSLVLELRTGGFYAEPLEDGSVALRIPGFTEGDGLVPVRRAWVDALSGESTVVDWVRAEDVEVVTGLRPAGGSPAIFASRRGTVRLERRGTGRRGALERDEAARVLSLGFQGDARKALVELAPLAWDERTGRLSLARRLVVQITFRGREATARPRRRPSTVESGLLAFLETREPGLYGLRFEELGSLRTPRELSLRRLGESVPYHLKPSGKAFGPGSTLYFVSAGAAANPYDTKAVYELVLGAAGTPMAIDTAPPRGPEALFFSSQVEREEDRLYQAGLVDVERPWLWDVLFAPVTKSYPFSIEALAPVGESALLEVWLQGASDVAGSPDHHVRVFVNGSFAGETSWDGKQGRKLEAPLLPGILHGGENVLSIENAGDTGAAYSLVMLDRFAVTYPRRTRTASGVLTGRSPSAGTARVEVGSSAHVLDVTGSSPRWLAGSALDPDGSVRFAVEPDRSYLVTGADSVLRPRVRRPSPLHSATSRAPADYLVIGPSQFLDAVAPLLSHRRAQGLRTRAVAVEEIYDAFGHGEARPEAIRSFLSFAFHEWTERPRYVVLLGDGTYDFKDSLKTGVENRVPPLLVRTPTLWTASDPSYAAVHGADGLPDLAIGRLPAANLDEVRALVAKILEYETSAPPAPDFTVLVADDPDRGGNFEANAEDLASRLLSSRPLRKIYLRSLGAAETRRSILEAFDEGASLLSYVGHGGIRLWADERIFDSDAVLELAPQPRQPVLLTLNCLNGYFHFPYFDSLAERLVKAPERGAIAAFSPSGLSLDAPAHELHEALLRELVHGGHRRLGDAILAAQSFYAANGSLPELLTIFHLLGDPALTLR